MALVDPRLHYFSEETQKLNNRLPEWHAGRRLRSSNWAQITSILDGLGLEDYKAQERRAYRNLFLYTAHLDELDLTRIVDLPTLVDLTPRQVNINILRNGSFETRARPDRVADYWSHTGTVVVESPALFGAQSVALSPPTTDTNVTARITQTISSDSWNSGASRVFSVWYRIKAWAGGTIPSTSHGLIVVVTYGNNTTETFRTAFASDTNDQWRRATLSITPTASVAKYEIRLETNRSASFDIDTPVRLDAVQAEVGATATSWQAHLFDQPNWFQFRARLPLEFDGPVPIFNTPLLREFYYEAVPTRATIDGVSSITSSADRRGGFGEAVDFHKQRWAYLWDVDTTNNQVRKIGLDPADIYDLMDLSFFTGTDTGPKFEEDVAGLTYRSVAGLQRWLWVVHEMTGLDGTTIVALSVVDPLVPYPSPTHYESKQTLILPVPAGIDYHRIEFRMEDPQYLYLLAADREYRLRLHYDYVMVDENRLQAHFRESYTSLAIAS